MSVILQPGAGVMTVAGDGGAFPLVFDPAKTATSSTISEGGLRFTGGANTSIWNTALTDQAIGLDTEYIFDCELVANDSDMRRFFIGVGRYAGTGLGTQTSHGWLGMAGSASAGMRHEINSGDYWRQGTRTTYGPYWWLGTPVVGDIINMRLIVGSTAGTGKLHLGRNGTMAGGFPTLNVIDDLTLSPGSPLYIGVACQLPASLRIVKSEIV